MKAYVDQDGCYSCGLCIDVCPGVFSYDDGYQTDEGEFQRIVLKGQKRRDGCSTEVISLKVNEIKQKAERRFIIRVSDIWMAMRYYEPSASIYTLQYLRDLPIPLCPHRESGHVLSLQPI